MGEARKRQFEHFNGIFWEKYLPSILVGRKRSIKVEYFYNEGKNIIRFWLSKPMVGDLQCLQITLSRDCK